MTSRRSTTSSAHACAFDRSLRILLLGDSCVGKSCLMRRYTCATFSHKFMTTVGIDYKYKFTDSIPGCFGKTVRLEIWDTAGQERFHCIARSYIKAAQSIVLVYDVTNRKSFAHVSNWLTQIRRHSARDGDGDTASLPIVLVGNKADLGTDRRVVSTAEGQALAEAAGLAFHETSAKSGLNVREAFEGVAAKALAQASLREDEERRRRVDAAKQEGPTPSCWSWFFGGGKSSATAGSKQQPAASA